MNAARRAVAAAAAVGSLLTGGAIGAAMFSAGGANAATSTTPAAATTPSTNASAAPPGRANFDPTKGGHVANGITEVLLTGDTAAKVKAAALAAVPGGTVQRVENDAEGSPYEAHVQKADGSQVTVKVGTDFKVTAVDAGAA